MNRKQRRALGATGDHPRGKLNADDEGGLALGLAVQDRTVILNFGKPVAWIGMGKDDAMALGLAIIAKAESIT